MKRVALLLLVAAYVMVSFSILASCVLAAAGGILLAQGVREEAQ